MREAIRTEISAIEPLDRLERRHLEETLEWIDSGVELCRCEKPATPPKHLVSYFVLVDGDWVLLVDHIKAQLWLPSGGHVEPGEHPAETVVREAKEELGIDVSSVCERPVFLTVTKTVGLTAGHIDVSLWYVLKGDRHAVLDFDQSEFSRIKWFRRDEVPYNRTDPHLGRFLEKVAPRL